MTSTLPKVVHHLTFFNVVTGFWMFRLGLFQALLLCLLSPVAHQCLSQLADLFNRSLLRLVGTATSRNRSFHDVRNGLQPLV
jgi:hypothetical protein